MAFSIGTLAAYVEELKFKDNIWIPEVARHDTMALSDAVIAKFIGVKSDTLKLPVLTTTATWQDGDNCTFAASGDDTITQASISLGQVKVNKSWCVRDLETKYTQGYLPAGQHYEGLGTIESDILSDTLKTFGNTMETNLWQGLVGTAFFAGWKKQIDDAITATTIAAVGTPAAISSSNALDKVEAVVGACMADASLQKQMAAGNMTFFMGHTEFYNYLLDYRATHGTLTHAQDENGLFRPYGTRAVIQPVAGLSGTSYIVAAENGNLAVAHDLMSDTSTVKVGMDQYDENVWMKMRFKMGVGFRNVSKLKVHTAA